MKLRAQQQVGLTRWEVTALAVCSMALLGVIVLSCLPVLARPHGGKFPMALCCLNNLKQVGLAYRLWANDFGGEYPFSSTNALGSLAWANTPEVFRHFQALSNELVTPKILHCRSDRSRSEATNFTQLSNTNLSYFVGLDAREDAPNSILSGDRFLTGGTLSNGFLRVLTPASAAGWTQDIHENVGIIGLGDGSAQRVIRNQLRAQIAGMSNTFIRLAVP